MNDDTPKGCKIVKLHAKQSQSVSRVASHRHEKVRDFQQSGRTASAATRKVFAIGRETKARRQREKLEREVAPLVRALAELEMDQLDWPVMLPVRGRAARIAKQLKDSGIHERTVYRVFSKLPPHVRKGWFPNIVEKWWVEDTLGIWDRKTIPQMSSVWWCENGSSWPSLRERLRAWLLERPDVANSDANMSQWLMEKRDLLLQRGISDQYITLERAPETWRAVFERWFWEPV